MRTRSRHPLNALVAAFAALGCSSGRSVATGNDGAVSAGASSSAAATPTRAAGVGEPELLVEGSGKIVLRGAESGRERELFRGPIDAAFFDPELDVVWVQSGTTLDAIDLRRATPEPVAIVVGLEAMPITVAHESQGRRSSGASSTSCVVTKAMTLAWTRTPHLEFITGDPAEKTRLEHATKLVGAAWLIAEVDRAPNPRVPPRRALSDQGPRPISPAKLPCNDEGPCGLSVAFGGASTWLVVTDYELGDCVHLGCRLYDPKRAQFATPPVAKAWSTFEATPAGPCGPYAFTPDEKRLLADDAVCSANTCVPVHGHALGWLDGEIRVGHDP